MGEMRGARRVLMFCLLTAIIPFILLLIPLYLRHSLYADVSYGVAESDVLEVVDGISPVFCQEQILRMNTSFRAFQLAEMPPLSHHRKHIKLRKSMSLSDDTMEYWGFYLLQGSQVSLFACSRYDGAGVLVVRGEKNLKTCNILESQRKPIKNQGSYKSSTVPNKLTSKSKFEIHKSENNSFSKIHLNTTNIESLNLRKGSELEVEAPDLHELAKDVKNYIKNYSNTNNRNGLFEMKLNELSEPIYRQKVENNSSQIVSNLNISSSSNVSLREDNFHGNVTVKSVPGSLSEDLLKIDKMSDTFGSFENLERHKRMHNALSPKHILDAGMEHGGNANITDLLELESSDSSFEESLHKCYEGQELSSNEIDPTTQCNSNMTLRAAHVNTIYIPVDGYYYFIFYSDNDYHLNPVHAEFDIFKTTYEHTNYTRGCINKTECRFPISFGGKEIVIVEIPTHDGIEHEDGDTSVLISSCYPRMSVYAIFPVAVLFLVLGCAFL